MFCPNGSSGILKFGHLSYKHYLLLLICINQSECAYILDVYLAPLQETFVNRGLFIYLPDLLNLLPLHHPTV